MRDLSKRLTIETAETLAARAFSYLAADEDLLPRFLAETGLSGAEIRSASSEPGFLAGVLEFLLQDESTLLAFAAADGMKPETIVAAHRALAGGRAAWE